MAACGGSLVLLHVEKDLQRAFATLVAVALPVLGAYCLLHGNRDDDLLFAMLFSIAAITFLGPRRSEKYLLACVGLVAAVVVIDEFLPRMTHPWAITPVNTDSWVFDAPDKYRFRGLELITVFSVYSSFMR